MNVDFYPRKDARLWTSGGTKYMFPHDVTSLSGAINPAPAGEISARNKWLKQVPRNSGSIYRNEMSDSTAQFYITDDHFFGGSDAQQRTYTPGSQPWADSAHSRLFNSMSGRGRNGTSTGSSTNCPLPGK